MGWKRIKLQRDRRELGEGGKENEVGDTRQKGAAGTTELQKRSGGWFGHFLEKKRGENMDKKVSRPYQ